MPAPSIVWFRQDLRLEDNLALLAAIARGEPVIPVYLWSPESRTPWARGSASRWWLHRSLGKLDEELQFLGSKLIIRQGDPMTELSTLIEQTGASAIYWNRCYEPTQIERDTRIKSELKKLGLIVESYNAGLLFEPWEVQTKEGRPYKVFTPFWKACLAKPQPGEPETAPTELRSPTRWPQSLKIEELGLNPTIPWDAVMQSEWTPGSASAKNQLQRFLDSPVDEYQTSRDHPAERGTSRLSPHLHFGEISLRAIWHETQDFLRKRKQRDSKGAETFLKEIGWREFAYHLLYHFPKTIDEPLRTEFSRFPWRDDAAGFDAWKRGQTGYPIVDAGMRELWSTGWMHNRVRMIVASFLVKDLLIPWQDGAAWFWDTLVDADLASNTLGWQWSAGCGADAAPYFRIFNPTLQSEKFDPKGDYLHRWIPELQRLPAPYVHSPWTAPERVLSDAGVQLGKTYPNPIVDHAEARQRALQSLAQISGSSS